MISVDLFKTKLKELLPSYDKHQFLLAVSGGADSMALAHLMTQIDAKIEIAHINYKLRGEDSDKDAALVQEFCEKHHIPFHCYIISEKDQKPSGSIQLWARELRYQFFRNIMKTRNLSYLVTAHHLNDQLETFIINLSRGSGIKGLAGIPNNENEILRPLLDFSKEEIYHFAEAYSIAFREDKSNQKQDYLRNKIRHSVVPNLEEINPDFLDNFRKSIDFLSKAKSFINQQIKDKIKEISISTESETIIDRHALEKESDFIQFEILNKFGFSNKAEISKMFTAETGKSFYSNEYQCLINREQLIISKKETLSNNDEEITLPNNKEINLNQWITYKKKEILEWSFDAEQISLPLKLRHKESGDFFYPKGMMGRKKVSKFFKDEKLSILAKSKIWLLCDNENRVLGIIPLRQDGRFASNDKTEKNIKIIL
ncbi:tRNA lysidine(34) synthetase TilS [Riemerella anatipestifer]|uniref:tRNA(Ile)-lysidine synthase n=1 Tax=Riemerella anatipestifer RA-CH-1 TaxID=1228997 RepID=J9R4W8_RIEAN|nr:tRNA lysidine(34) synthetase TilS [Riemerella anatipestifer]AFR35518.1 putative ATPase of the PP-loop superfamily implicated in cell cycle control [Riemerella anatipestifer RA-CH-1]MCO7331913.1 tRNA lysidine(34) synthetase TilS [Riemerella anatipestifer]MCO7350800.1 tRNA lysidine(34) synthetase TilS [Riemerella anatipestifer]MCU7583345.1 tRNA lysidine(34) synthetase TilS [Riemerella anatipestifer]MCW0486388.1 tRNA lysidine(34) synthetase TilS [Riemerella anatipestifer]